MVDTTWTLHGDPDTITIDGILSEYPDRTRGETTDVSIEITRRSGNRSGTGGQWSGTEGFQWSGEYGAAYPGTTVAAAEDRFDRLIAYADYADAVNYDINRQRLASYREHVPSRAPVNSLVVGLEPADDLRDQGIVGVWGLVVAGDAPMRRFGDRARVDLEIFVLDEYQEWDDLAAVAAEFEVPIN